MFACRRRRRHRRHRTSRAVTSDAVPPHVARPAFVELAAVLDKMDDVAGVLDVCEFATERMRPRLAMMEDSDYHLRMVQFRCARLLTSIAPSLGRNAIPRLPSAAAAFTLATAMHYGRARCWPARVWSRPC